MHARPSFVPVLAPPSYMPGLQHQCLMYPSSFPGWSEQHHFLAGALWGATAPGFLLTRHREGERERARPGRERERERQWGERERQRETERERAYKLEAKNRSLYTIVCVWAIYFNHLSSSQKAGLSPYFKQMWRRVRRALHESHNQNNYIYSWMFTKCLCDKLQCVSQRWLSCVKHDKCLHLLIVRHLRECWFTVLLCSVLSRIIMNTLCETMSKCWVEGFCATHPLSPHLSPTLSLTWPVWVMRENMQAGVGVFRFSLKRRPVAMGQQHCLNLSPCQSLSIASCSWMN